MRHDAFDLLVLKKLRPDCRDLVDQQIGAGTELDHVLIEAGVARDHYRASLEVDAVAISRLDLSP